jgi:type 1 fimbriae regulatory protein FimB
MKTLTAQELIAVLKAARGRSTRDHAMVLLAYRHGLRASEVCGLLVANIDVRTQSIDVHNGSKAADTRYRLYNRTVASPCSMKSPC